MINEDAWYHQAWLRFLKLPAKQMWLKARGYTMSENEARLRQAFNSSWPAGCVTCRRRRCRCGEAQEAK
ncbi:hypothetical protein H4696_008455 [Amycolatopsis lexingtonensis]|uniref:Uncharacterized protein n=1 Tax=Amycolatopsis lexingtonensis TaxID=218822 RepID=A0ABR9IDW7_9PSEU|nr:hypothetical protein [Amycolatopsis lexingtonensis]MBE1501355.1 hypothetical protein [Amycolatopsis lexingtonensis]